MRLYITDKVFIDKAQQIAAYTKVFEVVEDEPGGLYLRLDGNGLAIICKPFKPLYVTEIYAGLIKRYQNLKNELLVQALNLPRGTKVWDLTAGLGKDAFILASYGYAVTMVEQNPVLATIVNYALENKILPKRNLELVFGNSLDFLTENQDVPQAIYLDPMFKDEKSSKAKKDMQLIQLLAENNTSQNDEALFAAAYAKVQNKIIVKRDNKQAAIIVSPVPSHTKSGKTICFDVYTTNS